MASPNPTQVAAVSFSIPLSSSGLVFCGDHERPLSPLQKPIANRIHSAIPFRNP